MYGQSGQPGQPSKEAKEVDDLSKMLGVAADGSIPRRKKKHRPRGEDGEPRRRRKDHEGKTCLSLLNTFNTFTKRSLVNTLILASHWSIFFLKTQY